MHRLGILVLTLAPALFACGPPPPPAVQPPPLPAAQCLDFTRTPASPFTVNMSDNEQLLLQKKLDQEGLVLVHYDCNTLGVIDRCSAHGTYGYGGVEPRIGQVRMQSDQEVAVNLGSGLSYLASVGGGFSPQNTLDLAVMTVGSIATPINALSRGQLSGPDCVHATHYIRRADVGGFAMTLGQAPMANAAVSLFQVGVQTGSGQAQSIARVSGNAAVCGTPVLEGNAPPAGCGAIVRLGLLPLDEQPVSAERARASMRSSPRLHSCPQGHVFSAGACTTWTDQLPAYLCRGNDQRECEDQCNRGDLPSCGRFAAMLVEAKATAPQEELAALLGQLAGLVPKLEQACDAGEGAACGLLAISAQAALAAQVEDPESAAPDPNAAMMAARLAMQAERGCLAGDSVSCEVLWTALGPSAPLEAHGIATDTQRVAEVLTWACNGGNGTACAAMSLMAFDSSQMGDLQVDDPFSYTERACFAGSDIGCLVTGLLQLGMDKACTNVAGRQAGQLCINEGRKNLDRAESAFKRACELSDGKRFCDYGDLMPLIRECDAGKKAACKKLKKKSR